MASTSLVHSPDERRKFLLLATTGGFTHAAPILEIGAVLAARGHTIEFATLEGQQSWTRGYDFISKTHVVGPPTSEADLDAHYERMRIWRPEHGFARMMKSKYLWDEYWEPCWRAVRALCAAGSESRPDFVIADFFVEHVARDIKHELGLPIAVVWPQMPYWMAPASYHSGQPGFQADVTALTAEHASLGTRIANETALPRAIGDILPWMRWFKQKRRAAGVTWALPLQTKPDYVVLVNSFFGLEAPKELPPLIVPSGPILSDSYPPLDADLDAFLAAHERTLYVSLGTHINLPAAELDKVALGLIAALDAGVINGVIWAIPRKPRANFDRSQSYPRSSTDSSSSSSSISVADLLDGKHPDFRAPVFAPQRAVLAHPHTRLFFTHGGGSSANEAIFHGVPTLCVGFFFDQLSNSERLRQAGHGLALDKDALSPDTIAAAVVTLRDDAGGDFARNVLRMQRIAQTASRRKHLAADVVEEVLYDHELRFKDGVERSPMHLQTADVRMPVWKVRNWDLVFIGLSSAVLTGVAIRWALKEAWKRLPGAVWHVKHAAMIARHLGKAALASVKTAAS